MNTLHSSLIRHRAEKDKFFKEHPQSPLVAEQRALFTGLCYYDPVPELDMKLKPEQFSKKENVKLQTSTGEIRHYIHWGKVRFPVEGQQVELSLYSTPGSLEFFIPFMDATTGTETYASGRYVEAAQLPNGLVHLDLNMAYSPYCAYNEPIAMAAQHEHAPRLWSCPIPPLENRLKVAIRAGECRPEGAWVETSH